MNYDKKSNKRKRLWITYIVIILIAILFLGKVLHLPIAFMLIVGRSMEPRYRVGDLVVGVATYLKSFGIGDVVVWCRDFLRTACVVHRVIDVSEGYIVTKGDANPGPDSPVPSLWVSYVVVSYVPLYLWFPLIGLVIFLAGYASYIESEKRLYIQTGFVAIAIIASYIAINAFILGFTYIDNSPPFYSIPRVDLLASYLDIVNRVYVIMLNTSEYRFINAACSLSEGVSTNVSTAINGSIARLSIGIPSQFFSYLWNKSSAKGVSFLPSPPASVQESFDVSCTTIFDKAMLSGRYVAVFSWREPIVRSFNDTLIVENHNPVSMILRIELFSIARKSVVYSKEYVVESFSILAIDFSKIIDIVGEYDARIYYVFLGVVRGQGAKIRIG
jgi:signal peptidase I